MSNFSFTPITLVRTSRDAWPLLLPVLLLFDGFFAYITLAAYTNLVTRYGSITTAGIYAGPILFALLLWMTARYVQGLVWPTVWTTRITHDSVVMTSSGSEEPSLVLVRSDIIRFYIRYPKRYQPEGAAEPLMCETSSGETRLPDDFVPEHRHHEFLTAVERAWGSEYVPPPPSGTLHRRIRWWPPGLYPAEDA